MEVEQLLSTANPYIRRKAALCAMRIIRKVPELQDHFIDKTKLLLQDRNHGVLLCGITLVTDLCLHDPELVEQFRPFTPVLVKQLKALASSGYSPEHDVTGITDPFLQVKILKLMRVLGKGDEVISEQINDILAQVATNTDSTKNVGNSILYEAVLTILDIEADSSLRVLGINILGKFLSNKDNNIRYVALNTLVKVVALEPNAIQRHRNTILDCLRDPDISIRRRALELSFTLINADNVRLLIRELLAFLEIANNEFKPLMTTEISIAADKYAPSKRWQIDTMLRVLTLAGNYVKEPILSSFIRLVATTVEQQSYTVRKLYRYLKADITQEALTISGAWVIGEFGEYLLRGGDEKDSGLVGNVAESDIIDLFSNILGSAYATATVKEYILTALTKLTTRISNPAQIERVRRILDSYSADVDVEIQQRAVEYGNLFGSGNDIRIGVLEKMPPPEIREENRVLGEAVVKKVVRKGKPSAPASKDILNLLGDEPVATPTSATAVSNTDILLDLFGGGPSAPAAPSSGSADILAGLGSTPSAPAPPSSNDILSLFGNPSAPAPVAAPSGPPADAITVYDKNGLAIYFQIQRAPDVATIISHFRNNSLAGNIDALHLEFAVLKSQKLEFAAPLSAASLGVGQEATQVMRILQIGNVSLPPLSSLLHKRLLI